MFGPELKRKTRYGPVSVVPNAPSAWSYALRCGSCSRYALHYLVPMLSTENACCVIVLARAAVAKTNARLALVHTNRLCLCGARFNPIEIPSNDITHGVANNSCDNRSSVKRFKHKNAAIHHRTGSIPEASAAILICRRARILANVGLPNDSR